MRKAILAMAAVALFLGGATAAQAQAPRFGPQLSYGDDSDFGIGARAEFDLPAPPITLIGSFDFFFPDDGPNTDVTYWELNGNAVYSFNIVGAPTVHPYVGAGLNIAHVDVDRDDVLGDDDFDDTELGLNLVGGSRFDAGVLTPFVELRIELEGGEQFVLTGGLLF